MQSCLKRISVWLKARAKGAAYLETSDGYWLWGDQTRSTPQVQIDADAGKLTLFNLLAQMYRVVQRGLSINLPRIIEP